MRLVKAARVGASLGILLLLALGCVPVGILQEERPAYLPVAIKGGEPRMANYYVDNSGADGDGSEGSPWNNIDGHINDLDPGDTLHIMGDPVTPQEYDESVTVTVDGTDVNRITIQPYESDLILWTSGAGLVILEVDGDYFTVNGKEQLDFDKQEVNGTQAIKADGDHFELLDAEVQGVRGVASMVLIKGDYATLRNLEVHDGFRGNSTDIHGINIDEGIGTVVEYCDVYDVHGDCIYANDPESNVPREFVLRHNTLTATVPGKCGENGMDLKGSGPAGAGWSEVYGNTFIGFRACDNTCGGSGDGQGEGLSIHNVANKVRAYNNVFNDCTGGITVDDGVEDAELYNNIFYNMNLVDPNASFLAAIMIRGKRVKVWNNTFYKCAETVRTIAHPNFENNEVRNNIFSESGDVVDGDRAGITWSNNLWHNCDSIESGDDDITGQDPKLNDPDNGDVTLDVTSPAIDAGIDVGLPYFGDDPDIGAEEYQTEGDTVVSITIITTVLTVVTTVVAVQEG